MPASYHQNLEKRNSRAFCILFKGNKRREGNIGATATEKETALPEEWKSEDSSENSEAADNPKTRKRKNRLPLYIGATVLLVAAVAGFFYWLRARQFKSTDDAFIEADIVQVSPKIAADVSKVYVQENQRIPKSDLLVELETKDLEARLKAARAADYGITMRQAMLLSYIPR